MDVLSVDVGEGRGVDMTGEGGGWLGGGLNMTAGRAQGGRYGRGQEENWQGRWPGRESGCSKADFVRRSKAQVTQGGSGCMLCTEAGKQAAAVVVSGEVVIWVFEEDL